MATILKAVSDEPAFPRHDATPPRSAAAPEIRTGPLANLDVAPRANPAVVARARALQPMMRALASQAEDDRQVSTEVIRALEAEGLFNISTPKRLGGLGENFRTFVDVMLEVARADGGAAWMVGLLGAGNWFASLFSAKAQAEVFDDNPGVRLCGVFMPPRISERVTTAGSGGVRLTGEWSYASGSAHADWALLGMSLGNNPDGSPILALGLVPMTDLTIKDTWYVAGMKASGSNTLVGEDVFVPEHRIQLFSDLATGNYLREPSDEASDHACFLPVAEVVLASAQLGLAYAALDITRQKGATKSVAYTVFSEARQSPAHQIALAEAASEVDQAYLLLARACADIDCKAAAHEQLDMETRARIRMDAGATARLCRTAINRLLSVNGAGSFAQVNPLQRIWRDSEVASRHALVLPEVASLIYGRVLFGNEEFVQPF